MPFLNRKKFNSQLLKIRKIGIKYMKVKSRNCGSRQYSRIYGSIY